MIHLPHWIPVYLFRPMGWVVVHALWQVLLVALLYGVVSMLLQGRSPRLRYGVGCMTLLICLLLPFVTFSALNSPPTGSSHASVASEGARNDRGGLADRPTLPPPGWRAASETLGRAFAGADLWMPTVLGVWVLGLAISMARLALAWRRACRLASHGIGPVPVEHLQLLARLRARLAVDRAVALRMSTRVDSPALVGARRPVVLLPASAAKLPEYAIEPVLAHELAHIRRRDYAVNLIQSVIERVFFFHPLLHWISSRVRVERELCCDDLAARACEGGSIAYARGLANLEAMRIGAPVLAATEGNLMARIRRLVEPRAIPRYQPALAVVLLAGWLVLAGTAGNLVARSAAATVLGGLDPVLLIDGSHIRGSAELTVEHAGYRYLFADASSRSRFLADPSRYSVRNVAICPISGGRVRADIFRVVDGKILLFCCPEVGDLSSNTRRIDAVLRSASAGN